MQFENPCVRTLTELDLARLRKLYAAQPLPHVGALLEEADAVPGVDIPPDVVTMYTQFELEEPSGGVRTLAVCWPEDAEPASGFVSVLSPIGCALLGLREGSQAAWQTPAGPRTGRVAAVLFQPEASGDYVT